jgi:hypothetical protein
MPAAPTLNELLGTADGHTSSGRVLYAKDHGPRSAAPVRTARTKRPGSELVQSRSSAAPNS